MCVRGVCGGHDTNATSQKYRELLRKNFPLQLWVSGSMYLAGWCRWRGGIERGSSCCVTRM